MKKRLLILCCSLSILLTSCLDLTEYIQLKEDGSGVYSMELDLSKGMDMMSTILQMGEMMGQSSEMPPIPKYMDSTISLKTDVDTMQGLSDVERKLMSKALIHLKINDTAKTMFMAVRYPFASKEEFAQLQGILNRSDRLNVLPGMDKALTSGSDVQKLLAYTGGARFSFVLQPNVLERKATGDSAIVVLSEMAEGLEGEDADGMAAFMAIFGGSMFDISARTILELPAPCRTVTTNSEYKLSADKKKVTIEHLTADMKVLKPSSFTYKVEF